MKDNFDIDNPSEWRGDQIGDPFRYNPDHCRGIARRLLESAEEKEAVEAWEDAQMDRECAALNIRRAEAAEEAQFNLEWNGLLPDGRRV